MRKPSSPNKRHMNWCFVFSKHEHFWDHAWTYGLIQTDKWIHTNRFIYLNYFLIFILKVQTHFQLNLFEQYYINSYDSIVNELIIAYWHILEERDSCRISVLKGPMGAPNYFDAWSSLWKILLSWDLFQCTLLKLHETTYLFI